MNEFEKTIEEGKEVYLTPFIDYFKEMFTIKEVEKLKRGDKSFAVDLIAWKTMKLGVRGLWIDPKGDRTNWPADLKSFGD